MKKTNIFCRVLSLLLAFVLVAGYMIPARAVEAETGLKFGFQQIGNDAVSAELPLAQADRAAVLNFVVDKTQKPKNR